MSGRLPPKDRHHHPTPYVTSAQLTRTKKAAPRQKGKQTIRLIDALPRAHTQRKGWTNGQHKSTSPSKKRSADLQPHYERQSSSPVCAILRPALMTEFIPSMANNSSNRPASPTQKHHHNQHTVGTNKKQTTHPHELPEASVTVVQQPQSHATAVSHSQRRATNIIRTHCRQPENRANSTATRM